MKYPTLAVAFAIAGTSAVTNSIDDEAVKYERYRDNNFALKKLCNSIKWSDRGNIPSCTGYGLAGYTPGVPLDNVDWHNIWEAWALSKGTNGGTLFKIAEGITKYNRGDPIWFNWANWAAIAINNFAINQDTGRKYYTGTHMSIEDTPNILRQAEEQPTDGIWIKIGQENWTHGDEQLGELPVWYERFNGKIDYLDYTLGRALVLREMKFDDIRYSSDSLANMMKGLPANDNLFVDISLCPSNIGDP